MQGGFKERGASQLNFKLARGGNLSRTRRRYCCRNSRPSCGVFPHDKMEKSNLEHVACEQPVKTFAAVREAHGITGGLTTFTS